ncbi:acyltransferase family protein [Psychroserpens luteus]|uniref:Acyltransferase family protein n=1 Tax=Psychroserpens luteus TaxID=1434066 RepID=A0ABW5ZTJ6_9FLAO|nr:acyltransferase [Psychroserpens luteus]
MKFIKGFDGLRAISIMFVLLTHLGLSNHLDQGSLLKDNFNLISGSTGVMIFFTISGFLITLLLLHEKHEFQKINYKNFFARRFLRLIPPLLVFYISVVLLMILNYLPKNYLAVTISFFYLYNFVPLKYYVSEIGHTWSLAIEEQFYFIWPFILSYFKKIKSVVFLAVALIVVCIIVKTVYYTPFTVQGKEYQLFNYFFPNRWFIPACLPIMMGSLSAIILFYKHDFLKSIFDIKLLVLSFILFFGQLIIKDLNFIIIETLQPLAVSLLLLWIYFNQDNILTKVLEVKPIAFIGKISYGLYVYQGLFLRTGPGGHLDIQKFPLNIILVVVTAVCSYYLLEKPILKYKSRFKPN